MKHAFSALAISLSLAMSCLAEPASISLEKIGVYPCGKQPKQVLFSPDNKYVLLPLLEDTGFDVFSLEEKKVVRRISPPDADKHGFAEGLFIREKGVFLVSQMTTGCLYEYSCPGFEYKRTIKTGGTWSKFIAWSKERQLLAVSNWVSNDISIIDYSDGSLLRLISTGKAPRGMIFLDGGKVLVSLSFDSGLIEKFNVDTGKRTDCISVASSCMRHIACSSDQKTAFVSDMYNRQVYKLDLQSFKITGRCTVYRNPNTIDLLDDRWLFVSTRGPNNPQDYTKRSPSNGKIHIVDTKDMSIVKTFEGGNQPTGLDV
ncbi:MAG: YVTN family beta-propeller repeat-containing protein, partial [Treponema sp.]|nr:YVTN family beta-propeller repeat-containing protein [Treponema sp.]